MLNLVTCSQRLLIFNIKKRVAEFISLYKRPMSAHISSDQGVISGLVSLIFSRVCSLAVRAACKWSCIKCFSATDLKSFIFMALAGVPLLSHCVSVLHFLRLDLWLIYTLCSQLLKSLKLYELSLCKYGVNLPISPSSGLIGGFSGGCFLFTCLELFAWNSIG